MFVLRLGAWCDYVTDAEYRDDLAGQLLPAREIDRALEQFRRGLSFRVQEFAVLADGRRLTLHDERGFSTQPSGSDVSTSVDPWQVITLKQLESDVRTTVLPDDDTGDEHPWTWLAELLAAHAVAVAPEQLKQLPYEVELSQRLRVRLGAQATAARPPDR